MNFKTTLKQLWKKAGLTQAQLAEDIGANQAAVGRYEMGIKAPELAKPPSIAKALRVSVADLIKEEFGQPAVLRASCVMQTARNICWEHLGQGRPPRKIRTLLDEP